MKTSFTIYFLFCSILLISCGSDDDAMSEPDPEPDMSPISTQISTYQAHVKTIIDTHCISCHSNPPTQGAPMSLETFDEVVNAENNRGLFARISTTNEFNVMPQSGRLPDETILIVEDWIEDGFQEQ